MCAITLTKTISCILTHTNIEPNTFSHMSNVRCIVVTKFFRKYIKKKENSISNMKKHPEKIVADVIFWW